MKVRPEHQNHRVFIPLMRSFSIKYIAVPESEGPPVIVRKNGEYATSLLSPKAIIAFNNAGRLLEILAPYEVLE